MLKIKLRGIAMRGITLVEVMIAVAILAAVIVPIFTMFQTGTRGTVKSRNLILGVHLARSVMELLKSMPFEMLKTTDMEVYLFKEEGKTLTKKFKCDGNFYDDVRQFATSGYFDDYMQRFSIMAKIEDLPDDNVPTKLKRIIVGVRFIEQIVKGKEISHQFSIATIVSNPMVQKYDPSSTPKKGDAQYHTVFW